MRDLLFPAFLLCLALGLTVGCDSDPVPSDAALDGSVPSDAARDASAPDASGDRTPPTPSATPPTVEVQPGRSAIGFEPPADEDYAGTLVVRALGSVRPTDLPPSGEARSVGDAVGTGEVVAVLAAGDSDYEDTTAEGDVCWSLFGFDAAFNYADLGGGCLVGVDLTPPPSPLGFTAVAGGEWIGLNWEMPLEEVARLRVVSALGAEPADSTSGSVVCDPCEADGFDVVGLTAGDTHHYAVFAYDDAGNESEPARAVATVGGVTRSFIGASLPDDDLFGVSVAADGSEFAVGRNGVVLRRLRDDRWEELPRPTGAVISAVWAASASDAWLTSGTGTSVFHWDGSSYETVATSASSLVTCFWGNGPSDVYAGGNISGIDHWDGTSWTHIADFADTGSSQQLRSIYAPSADRIFGGDSGGNIVTWNGSVWSLTDTGTEQVRGLWGSSASNVFAMGPNPGWRYDGGTWAESPGMPNAIATDGAAPDDVKGLWFGSVSSFDGTEWTFDALPGAADGNDIAHVGGGEWLVVGEAGSIWRLLPGGSWALESGGSGDSLLAISGAPDDSFAAAVGASNTVLQRTDAGFVAVSGGSTSTRFDVDVASAEAAVAVGSSRAVQIWDGTGWTNRVETQFPSGASIRGVWTRSAADYWMIGAGVVHRSGSGVTAYPELGFTGSQNTIFGFDDMDVWAGGGATDAGAVSHFDGTTWAATIDLCGRIEDIHGLAPDDVWAVGAGGCVVHFDGTTWSTMDAGVTVDLASVWAADRRNVYLGGEDGTLLRWDGAAFEVLSVDTTGTVSGIWATSAENVWLAGTEGAWLRRSAVP